MTQANDKDPDRKHRQEPVEKDKQSADKPRPTPKKKKEAPKAPRPDRGVAPGITG